MKVLWQTFEQYHNRKGTGSTKIRVHNLLKYWDEAELYKYGEKADVMIFQKVYCTYDYKFPINYPGIKILDTCDLDWQDTPDVYIKETIDGMDAVTVPTEPLQKLLQQMTDTPVRVIKDRFDLAEFPTTKKHFGETKTAVWFGYMHNADLIKHAIQSLERRGIHLIVISNQDPVSYKYAINPDEYEKRYTFLKYNQATIYKDLQKADVCILPKGNRPQDRYKSENKTVIAQLCGLPVVTTADELDALKTSEARSKAVDKSYNTVKEEYNCIRSINEYKRLIKEIGS